MKFLEIYKSSSTSLRSRRLVINSFSAFGAKGINFLTQFVSLPLMLHYLGTERFGMVSTIIATIGALTFADLGIGLGLQNRIPHFDTLDDKTALKKSISTTFFLLCFVTAILFIIVFSISPRINWASFYNVNSIARHEASTSTMVFLYCFLLSIPFSIIQKVQNGFQRSFYNEFWTAASNMVSLLMLVLVIYYKMDVPYILLAFQGTATIFLILNFYVSFLKKYKSIRPAISYFDFSYIKPIFWEGFLFFLIQCGILILIASDNIIIARSMGLKQVAEYNVGVRLITIFTLPIQIAILPALASLNDAFFKKDVLWVTNFINKALKGITIASIISATIVLLFSDKILHVWISPEFSIDQNFKFMLCVYLIYFNFYNFFGITMCSMYFLKYTVPVYLLATIITLCLKVLLVKYLGLNGVLLSTILGMSILFFIPSILKLKKNNFI